MLRPVKAEKYGKDMAGLDPVEARTMALYSATPTPTDGGTEIAGGGYARQTVEFAGPDPDGWFVQSNEIVFGPNTDGVPWETAVAFALIDAGGAIAAAEQMLASTVPAGKPLLFKAGSLRFRFPNY